MAALIAHTDFVDDCQLSISKVLDTEFASFLERKEKEFLRAVLGVTLFNLFYVEIKKPSPDAKWTKLFAGSDYYLGGEDAYFEGLKQGLICYCYVHWLKDRSTINVSSGNVATKQNNADTVAPIGHFVAAQNKCIDNAVECALFIDANAADYPNHVPGLPFSRRFNVFAI